MGNFAFTVPTLGNSFIDYRTQILGDSFTWSWVHPLSEYRYIVIHHAAGPDTQTPDEIAAYHVNSRGWGGIGYHFVVSQNGTVYYVGDLTTARAHVANMNHLCIGICLVGSFIGGKEPPDSQLRAVHELCAQMLFRTPELSGVDGWEDVVGHKELGSTRCPSDTWPNWRPRLLALSTPPTTDTRRQQIISLYQIVFGRDPDQSGFDQYVASTKTIDQIRKEFTESPEHRAILTKAQNFARAKDLAILGLTQITSARDTVEQITHLG